MYYLFLFGRWLVLRLPRSISYRLAAFIAWIKTVIARRDSEVMAGNLEPVLKSRARARKMVFRVIANFSYYLVDFFGFSRIDRKFVDKYVAIEGRHYFDDLIARKEKIIVFSAHLGNYELGAAVLGLLGYEICVLALPHKDPRLNRFFNRQRGACGVEVAQTGAGVKRCFRALNEGKLVALVGDRDFFGQGAQVKMFGRTCVIPRGPAVLSLHTDAVIIPVFLVREEKYGYRYLIQEPISPYKDGEKKSEEDLLGECAGVLSRIISRYPEQWYLFERYWKE